MFKVYCASLAAALMAGASASAVAQAPAAAPAQATANAKPADNANEMVCQKQEVIGTRLGTKKVCKTRAEWADARTQDRHELERVQVQRGSAGQ